MLKIQEHLKIFLNQCPVDMRKSIAGLSLFISQDLKLEPQDGSIYIFWNRNLNKIKILFYDRNGFVLYYKILDRKKFSFIKNQILKIREISVQQLDFLLAGLDIEILEKFPEINYKHFF